MITNEGQTFLAIPLDSLKTEENSTVKLIQNVVIKKLPQGFCFLQEQPNEGQEKISEDLVYILDGNDFLVEPNSDKILNNEEPEVYSISQNDTSQNVEDFIQTKIESPPITVKFSCSQCNKEFSKAALYRKHMNWHEATKKYTCSKCSAAFNNPKNLDLHMAVHSEGAPKCPECNLSFQRLASLKSHLLLHQVEESINCTECSLEFDREEDLLRHVKTHETPEIVQEPSSNTCNFCQVQFESVEELKEHVSNHIKARKFLNKSRRVKKAVNKRSEKFRCQKCCKGFSRYSFLVRHVRIHTGERPYVCNICDRRFTQKGSLKLHLSKHTGEKLFECTLCSAKFRQKGTLKVHLDRTHTASAENQKLYKCSLCTCIFRKIASLNGHMTKFHLHNKEPNVIESVMNSLKQIEQHTLLQKEPEQEPIIDNNIELDDTSSYVKLSELSLDGDIKKHLVKQIKIQDTRYFLCNYCNKKFKKPSDLMRHVRTHTKEKPFKCKHCSASFALKATLVTHMRTHKKNYKCVVCNAKFSTERNLNAHLKKHEMRPGVPKYRCSVCDKYFSTIETARSHKQIHKEQMDGDSVVEPLVKQPLLQTSYGMLALKPPRQRFPNNGDESPSLRPHLCSKCGARFSRLINLKRHLQWHTGERQFKCDMCPKEFITAYKLTEHKNYHNNIRNYTCKICQKKFVTASLLKRHEIVHNSHRPYVCPYCDKKFKTVLLCRAHLRKVHKREVSADVLTKIEPEDAAEREEPPLLDLTDMVKDEISLIKIGRIENQINMNSGDIYVNNNINEPQVGDVLPSNFYEINKEPKIEKDEFRNALYDCDNANLTTMFVNCEDLQLSGNGKLCNTVFSQLQFPSLQSDSMLLNPTDLQDQILFNIDPVNTQMEKAVEIPNEELFSVVNPSELNEAIPTKLNEEDKPARIELLDLNDDKLYPNVVFINEPSEGQEYCVSLACNEPVPPQIEEAESAGLEEDDSYNNPNTNFICLKCNVLFVGIDKFKEHQCSFKENEEEAPKEEEQLTAVSEVPEDEARTKKKGKVKVKKKDSYDCVLCQLEFKKRADFLKHSVLHKGGKRCKFCEKEFKKLSDLKRHLRTHTGERPYVCDKCDKKFALKSTLETHLRTHDPAPVKQFNCQVCNSFYSTKSTLKVHMLLHTGKKPFACNFCSAKFRTAAHRKNHENTHHSSKPPKEPKITAILETVASEALQNVEIGNEVQFSSMNPPVEIQENVPTITTNLHDPMQMDFLQSLFLQEAIPMDDLPIMSLKAVPSNIIPPIGTELPQEDSKVERKFECDICHKKYASKDVLRKHKKIHGDSKGFVCDKCMKGFCTQDDLDKHMKVHSGYRPFSCLFCNNSFSTESSLKTHMKRIHNIASIQKGTLEEYLKISFKDVP